MSTIRGGFLFGCFLIWSALVLSGSRVAAEGKGWSIPCSSSSGSRVILTSDYSASSGGKALGLELVCGVDSDLRSFTLPVLSPEFQGRGACALDLTPWGGSRLFWRAAFLALDTDSQGWALVIGKGSLENGAVSQGAWAIHRLQGPGPWTTTDSGSWGIRALSSSGGTLEYLFHRGEKRFSQIPDSLALDEGSLLIPCVSSGSEAAPEPGILHGAFIIEEEIRHETAFLKEVKWALLKSPDKEWITGILTPDTLPALFAQQGRSVRGSLSEQVSGLKEGRDICLQFPEGRLLISSMDSGSTIKWTPSGKKAQDKTGE